MYYCFGFVCGGHEAMGGDPTCVLSCWSLSVLPLLGWFGVVSEGRKGQLWVVDCVFCPLVAD